MRINVTFTRIGIADWEEKFIHKSFLYDISE